MTLEEAQEKIIELNEELKTNKETLSTLNETIKNNETLLSDRENEINSLKEHNMKLFLKVANEEKVFEDPAPKETENKKSWDSFKIDLNK